MKSLEQPHSLVEERGIFRGACGGFNCLIGAIGLFLPAMCPQPFTDLPPVVERTLWVGFVTLTLMLIATGHHLSVFVCPAKSTCSCFFPSFLTAVTSTYFAGRRPFADSAQTRLSEDFSRLVL